MGILLDRIQALSWDKTLSYLYTCIVPYSVRKFNKSDLLSLSDIVNKYIHTDSSACEQVRRHQIVPLFHHQFIIK